MTIRPFFVVIASVFFFGYACAAPPPPAGPLPENDVTKSQPTMTFAKDSLAGGPAIVAQSVPQGTPQSSTRGTPGNPNDIRGMAPEMVLSILEATVYSHVRTKYVRADEVSDIKLRYGALKGAIASLGDQHSEFLTPDEAKKFKADMEGEFFGIGATLSMKDGRVLVTKVTTDSPARRAGVKQGDVIAAVDGKATYDETLDQTVGRIRGEEGEPVVLTILRAGSKKVMEISVERGKVVTNPEVLTWKLARGQHGKKIMVINVPHFDEEAMTLFREAVAETTRQGADGVVLNLLNNPGGLLTAAREMSCAWLSSEKHAVIIENRNKQEQKLACNADGKLLGMPTVVLVNKYSASASEIVAGALQDYSAATIIGETSFGKGSVQAYMTFPEGSMLRLTVDLWKTPLGNHINKIGVTPNEIIKSEKAQMKRAIRILSQPQ